MHLSKNHSARSWLACVRNKMRTARHSSHSHYPARGSKTLESGLGWLVYGFIVLASLLR